LRKIVINGVIGYDITEQMVRNQLKYAGDDDVEFEISSPGGSVFEGLTIYNLIKNYKGKTSARITGLAASMASYIPLAADYVSIEENAVYMIHNPWSIIVGDYNELRKQADIMEGLANILADAYTKKTKKKKYEILELMSKESFFYGKEILENGFADELLNGGEEGETVVIKDKSLNLERAMESIKSMKAKMQAIEVEESEKIAAYFKPEQIKAENVKNPEYSGKNKNREVEMSDNLTLDKLKAEYPEIFNQVVEIGVNKERTRTKAHLKMGEATGNYKDMMSFIREGKDFDSEVQASYMSYSIESKKAEENAKKAAEVVEKSIDDVQANDTSDASAKTEEEIINESVQAILSLGKEAK
jgi:ATP-dependent protease ClpP protease subunit